MEIIESYNKTDLSEIERTPYSRIDKDKDLYIPIKIITAQSRATERWYTIRYVKAEDIKEYLKENKKSKKYCKKK